MTTKSPPAHPDLGGRGRGPAKTFSIKFYEKFSKKFQEFSRKFFIKFDGKCTEKTPRTHICVGARNAPSALEAGAAGWPPKICRSCRMARPWLPDG